MPAPVIYKHPIKRPAGFLSNARFEGDDDRLYFRFDYPDLAGNPHTLEFRLFTDGADKQEMCIATSLFDIANIERDVFVAHIRMASMVAGAIPTSKEWEDAMTLSSPLTAKYFQGPVGEMRITQFSRPNQQEIDVEFQRGTTTNRVTHRISINELTQEQYVYAPDTQLRVVSGSVLKAFGSSHRHNFPGDILTAQERTDIINYVNTLEPWV